MKVAESELHRALGNLEAMAAHIDAMDHTIEAFAKQMEAARHELAVMRLDFNEVHREIRAAVQRLQLLRAQIEVQEQLPPGPGSTP